MNVLGAILKDSFHEARDRRALFLMGLMTLLAVAFCFGISFEERDREQLLENSLNSLGSFERFQDGLQSTVSIPTNLRVETPRPIDSSDTWVSTWEGGVIASVTEQQVGALDRLKKEWGSFFDKAPSEVPETSAWIARQLRKEGWDQVQVQRDESNPLRYQIAVRVSDLKGLRGAYETSLFYGLMNTGSSTSREEFVLQIQMVLAGGLLGAVGIFLALLTCAGFVPTMLTKGTLDLSLARPVGRIRLLLYKYLGGLWFISVTAVMLVGSTWLALALKVGVTDLRYLVMAPICILIFAILYAPVVLISVLTRSGNIAGLAGIAVWWISSIVVSTYDYTRGYQDLSPLLRTFLRGLYAVLPKTSHISDAGQRFLVEGRLGGGERAQRVLDHVVAVDWTYSIATTAAFTIACLALASWTFKRTDY